jgi:hypothetical protein
MNQFLRTRRHPIALDSIQRLQKTIRNQFNHFLAASYLLESIFFYSTRSEKSSANLDPPPPFPGNSDRGPETHYP